MANQTNDLEQLAARLAEMEGSSTGAADATVIALKAELDTLARELKQPPVDNAFEREPVCGKVTAMVQALGHIPDDVSEQTIAPSSETGKPSATAETPLGNLGVYELLAKLGEGGMGAVYKARHTKLDKIVAIKVLPAERMKDKGAVARFEREMRAVGKLEHPNIVRAMDAGESAGMHYLVMEYVQGVDLSQLVKQRHPLAIADACELIRQAAIGLDEAHDNGMVHRDIKPSNLMLCVVSKKKPPVVKILDMGLALLSEAHSPDAQGLTNTGQMMGTLDYMAPEQGGDSKNVDIRADIYALGASLYKLLCGEAIYHGEKYQTPVQKMMALATQPAPPIQKRRKGVPNELAAVIYRMLEKNPDKRYATPAEVAQAVAPFCAGANLTALLNSVGFDLPAVKDASPSATQPSFSAPDSDTGVSLSRMPAAKPPVAAPEKTNPALAKPPAARTAAPPPAVPRVDLPAVAPAAKRATIVPRLHTKTTPAAKSGGRKLPPWLPLAIGGSLLGFGGIVALAAAVIFFFQTPNGTLRVEINDPSIEVTVKGTDIVIKQADQEAITLTPGEHALVVKRGDFTFDTKNFALKKGETTTVKVDLLPGKVQVALADGAILGEKVIGDRLAINEPRLPNPGSDPTSPATGVNGSPSQFALDFDGKTSYVELPTLERNDAGPFKGGNFALDQWHHVAYVLGERDAILFLNGREVARGPRVTAEDMAPLPPVNRGTMLGSQLFGDNKAYHSMAGSLDEVRISKTARYDKNFTPAERFEPDHFTLALYHFDEGQGDVLRDSSGNNHHGKIVGAKWVKIDGSASSSISGSDLPAGKFALKFEPGNSAIAEKVPYLKSLPMTIEAWATLEPSLYVVNAQNIVGTPNGHLALVTDGLWFYTFHGRAHVDDAILPKQRVHIAGVNDGKMRRLYMNGRLIAKTDDAGELSDVLARQENPLGTLQIGGHYVNAVIDAVRISTTARYDKEFTPPAELTKEDDTFALYLFNEGQGDVLHDSSGNGYDAKITGAKWVTADDAATRQTESGVGFVPLFNNEDLTGWNPLRSGSIDWKNENGKITGRNRSWSVNAAGVLRSQKEYRDFHLRCEVFAATGAEPALLFRSGGRLIRGERHGYALMNPVHSSPTIAEGWGYGSLYADDFQVPPPQCRLARAEVTDLGIQPSEWYRLEIIAQGETIEIRVNGRRTAYYTSDDPALNKAGSISFRCQAGTTVAFRNLEIKDLSEPATNEGDLDRQIAHWFLATEDESRYIFIRAIESGETADVRKVGELPAVPFRLTGISLNGGARFADEDVERVAALPELNHLMIAGAEGLTDKGIERLTKFPALDFLSLSAIAISDESIAIVARIPRLASLQIDRTPISDAALKTLQSVKGLTWLDIKETQVSEAAVKELATALPRCKIEWNGGVIEPTVKTPDASQRHSRPALQFAGTKSYVELPLSLADDKGPLTVEAWLLHEDKDWRIGLQAGESALQLIRDTKGQLSWMVVNADGETSGVRGSLVVDQGKLTHLAATIDGEKLQLFVDGQPLDAAPRTGRMPKVGNFPSYIGWAIPNPSGRADAAGTITGVRISKTVRYSDAFTPASQLTTDANTLALYTCEEGQGDVLGDSSGNKQDGKIVGAKWISAE